MKALFSKTGIFIVTIIALILVLGFEPVGVNTVQAQTATISGKITQIDWGMWTPSGRRKAILHIKTAKGNHYQVHVGMRTEYVPHKTPEVGNWVSCKCEKIRGVWAAHRVTYK